MSSFTSHSLNPVSASISWALRGNGTSYGSPDSNDSGGVAFSGGLVNTLVSVSVAVVSIGILALIICCGCKQERARRAAARAAAGGATMELLGSEVPSAANTAVAIGPHGVQTSQELEAARKLADAKLLAPGEISY